MFNRASVSIVWLLAAASVASGAAANVEYSLQRPGYVSVAVYDSTGRLVRTLLRGQKRPPGSHAVAWDGLNQSGRPVPRGTYGWRLLQTPGFTAAYQLTVGTNPKPDEWARWTGNHTGVTGVTVGPMVLGDDETRRKAPPLVMYLSGAGSEVLPGTVVQTLDGKRILHYDLGKGGHSIAVGTAGGGHYYRYHRRLGTINFPDETSARGRGVRFDGERPLDVDVHGSSVVAVYPEHGAVRWLDPKSGAPLRTINLSDARAVAVSSDESLYVATSGRIVHVARDGTNPRVFADGLTDPQRVDYEHASGELVVFEGGESRQVKRFGPDGKLLKVYGRRGGRPTQGVYRQRTSFAEVSDLAADEQGGFIISEAHMAPRRVTHFDRNGAILDEWYGGLAFFAHAEFDPADPSQLWVTCDKITGWMMKVQVDYRKKSWRPAEVYQTRGMAAGLMTGPSTEGLRPRRIDGRLYLVDPGKPEIFRVDEAGHRLLPVSAIGVNVPSRWELQPDVVRPLFEFDNPRKAKLNSYIWTDRNGNGMPEREEFRLFAWKRQAAGFADADLDYYFFSADGSVRKLARTGFNACGAPLYGSLDAMEEVALEFPAGAPRAGGYGVRPPFARRDSQGNFYAVGSSKEDRQGVLWPGDVQGSARLFKWTADGSLVWMVGQHAVTRPNPPGQLHSPAQVIGSPHNCTVVADRIVQPAVVWDEYGLYAGRFFDHCADDGLPVELYCWHKPPPGVEPSGHFPRGAVNYDMLAAGAMHQLDDDTVLFAANGWNNVRLYRVSGFAGWRRQLGNLELLRTPPSATGTGAGLRGCYYQGKIGHPPEQWFNSEPKLTRIDRQIAFNWSGQAKPQPMLEVPPPLSAERFAVRWEGRVEAEFTEAYRFTTQNNDGIRVWLDGKLIVDDWNDFQSGLLYQYTYNSRMDQNLSTWIPLSAGRKYALRVEYYENAKFQDRPLPQCHLMWESAITRQRQHIPSRFLYPLHD